MHEPVDVSQTRKPVALEGAQSAFVVHGMQPLFTVHSPGQVVGALSTHVPAWHASAGVWTLPLHEAGAQSLSVMHAMQPWAGSHIPLGAAQVSGSPATHVFETHVDAGMKVSL